MAYKHVCPTPKPHHHNLMYKLIGADQKEYGPVSAEQLRQWVAEGRLNAQSRIRAEGETEWKAMSAFPEFADILRTTPGVAPSTPGERTESLSSEAVLGRDYSLDIGYCISRSWDLVKRNFWPVVGISLLIIIISAVINQIISLASGSVWRGIIQQRHLSAGVCSSSWGLRCSARPFTRS